MNTIQIEKYISALPVQNVGVYASDQLPYRISPSTAMIVNTDPHNEDGTHWVAFYLDGDEESSGIIEFFDSYGQPPHLYFYQGFLRRNARRYVYNEHRLQSDNTQVCGQYCLVYLYLRTHQEAGMEDFAQLFDFSSTAHNDALIKRLFENIYLKK